MMMTAFALAVSQLGDRAVLRVLLKTILLSLLVFAGLGALLYALTAWALTQFGGDVMGGTSAGLAGALAVLAALFAAFLWFRMVAIAVLQLFGDDIVLAVERRYYPAAATTARTGTLTQNLSMGLRGFARALLLNLVALPLYITLFFTGIGLPVAFLAVNALLLGRDLQDMVVARHSDDPTDTEWALGRARRFVLGLIVAALFLVPFVNLLAPVIGAAMATHLVHRSRGRHKRVAASASEEQTT